MTPFLRFTLLSASLLALLLPKRTARACGFSVWPGTYRFWLLQPDIVEAPDLSPFYFASTYLYHDDLEQAARPDLAQNLAEWRAETGPGVTLSAIDTILNHTDPDDFPGGPDDAATNSFLRWLQTQGHEDALRYMQLSKEVESIAANPDPWEEQGPNVSAASVAAALRDLHHKSKSPFLQLRCAFQGIRVLGFSRDTLAQQQLYDAWVAPGPGNSWVKAAALYQLALQRSGPARGYLFAKAFAGGYRRSNCLIHFRSEDADAVLAMAGSRQEQATVLAMRAFNNRGRALGDIKRIRALERHHRDLSFLLLREINKIEDWLLTSKTSDFGWSATGPQPDYDYNNDRFLVPDLESNRRRDISYAMSLAVFLRDAARDVRGNERVLLHLYDAHLSLLLRNRSRARSELRLAESVRGLPRKLRTQVAVSRLLLDLEEDFGPETERRFMRLATASDSSLGVTDPDILRNQLVLYTARKLMARGDRVRGLLLLSQTNRALGELPISSYKGVYQFVGEEALPADYDAMIAVLDRARKSAFERFVTRAPFRSPEDMYLEARPDSSHGYWDRNRLLDYKASWYLRRQRPAEALPVLKAIPESYWHRYPYDDYYLGDPFYVNLFEKNEERDRLYPMTKPDLVRGLLRRERELQRGIQPARAALELGNAWFNMSYHGKSWLATRQYRSMYELEGNPYRTARVQRSAENDDYYGCKKARAYYETGWRHATDRRLKTFCYYMMQQCDRRWLDYLAAVAGIDESKRAPFRMPGEQALRRQGVDAAYFNDLVAECQVYAAFIRDYRR
ncbi:hypothetical protein EPD60_07015 [Flaviaesturariibacter flavus]|uniref:Uncharacterized protein n=1 Tax=Flaviaesturariibacter flavus TaxID=2502780 RepID=A0A4R1BIB8_9BACT|nr:hypothetical protein [Flaviaesturariibacter flavus]TCJ17055.1 hypothetical protein EPD60_07015 [Flaviaesturariibacter flavus]